MDVNTGVQCGLEQLPEIVDETCEEFDPKTEDLLNVQKRETESEKFEEEKNSSIYWTIAGILIPLIGLIVAFYNKSELNENYRWTITSSSYQKNVFSLKSPLLSKTYLFSTYQVDGIEYENKTELPYENNPSPNAFRNVHYLIRFNPENPQNSQIPDLNITPYGIQLEYLPKNGIHKDSLRHFIKSQKNKRRSYN